MKLNKIATIALAATIGFGSMTAMADDNNKKNDNAVCTQQTCALQGITLTEKQQAEIAALQANRKKDLQARRDQRDKDRKAGFEQRQADRKNYLAELKKILTPEQYVQMLENNFVNGKGLRADGRKFDKNRKDGRNGKDQGRKNDRKRGGNRQASRAASAAAVSSVAE